MESFNEDFYDFEEPIVPVVNKTTNTVTINHNAVQIKEFNGQRVITFKDVDMLHERPVGTARKNFSNNKQHFIKDADYFFIKPSDVNNFPIPVNNAGLTLLTESGYLMLVKSFQDDLAWEVQRQLVNNYFRVKDNLTNNLPHTYKEALLQLVAAEDEKEKLQLANKQKDKQLQEQQPKVEFVEHISSSENSLLVREVAKIISKKGIKIGERKLYQKLRKWGFVFQNSCEATQKAINQGLMEVVEGSKENSKGIFTYKTSKVTGKGQVAFFNRLKEEI